MLPKKGKELPEPSVTARSQLEYAAIVAGAMRTELDGSHRATKTVMRWTGASERTVKNWLSGEKGPSGRYLLRLIHESNAVLHSILRAAGRGDMALAVDTSAVGTGEREKQATARGRSHAESSRRPSISISARSGSGSLSNDPASDPANDPDHDPVNRFHETLLNRRQRWFLSELAAGTSVRMADIMRRWGVAEKTAKRDISALKVRSLIEFIGAPKNGRYQLLDR